MPTTTRKRPSLGELADRFEAALTEKKDLESRLSKTLGEVASERSRLNSEITSLRGQLEQLQRKNKNESEQAIRQRAVGEFESERNRLNSEIAALRAQLEPQKKSQSGGEGSTVSSAAKERLIKEELERKFQAMIVEARREQKRYAEQLAQLKIKLSQCVCQPSSGGHDWA
jgi:chromosome segregation ATPase